MEVKDDLESIGTAAVTNLEELQREFSAIWSKALNNGTLLPGAKGPHMGMGIEPPNGAEQRSALTRHAGRPPCNEFPAPPSVFEFTRQSCVPRVLGVPSLAQIPRDIMVRLVFQALGPRQLSRVCRVCKEWKALSETSNIWRNLFLNVKFWRIWYNNPTNWKSEFERRHRQETEFSERWGPATPTPGALPEAAAPEDAAPATPPHPAAAVVGAMETDEPHADEDVPHWHRRWRNTDLPTVMVSPQLSRPQKASARACVQFSSIQEAVDYVEPGSRIVVAPGVYREQGLLRIDKAVEVVGEAGAGNQVFVDANIDMCMGRLANLNIRTQPTSSTQGAVELKGACQATIEDCNIEGSLILSDSRETLVRNNFIHSGQQNGVLVEGGDGSIINNDVTGHKMCGLVLKGNANPMVRNNTFNKNKLAGIVIGDDAHGTFEANRTVNNTHYGMAVGATANPMIRGNHCNENKMGGLLSSGNSSGKFEDNVVKGNSGHGMVMAGHSTALTVRNKFSHNAEAGMAVCGSSTVHLEDNDVFSNSGPGVIIQDAASPIVRRNIVKTNECEGIVVLNGGGGTLEHNQVSLNRLAGVVLNENACSTVRSNTVNKNKGSGIVVRDNAVAHIIQNKVQENELAGVSIHDKAETTLTENLVSHNQSAGIALADNSQSVVQKNHVLGNALSGIEIWGDSMQTLRQNRVSRNAQAGCVVGSSGRVCIEDNHFKNNTLSEVVVQDEANQTTIKNNSFTSKASEILSLGSSLSLDDNCDPLSLEAALSQETDFIGTAGMGKARKRSIHLADRMARLCIFCLNSSAHDATVVFELWRSGEKKVTTVRVPSSSKPQLVIPGVPITPGCDVWAYAPGSCANLRIMHCPEQMLPDQLMLYGFCVVDSESQRWEKHALQPSDRRGGLHRKGKGHKVGATQARYELNTGSCLAADADDQELDLNSSDDEHG